MIDWSNCSATENNPAIASGAWVIRGTRIPVAVIFENFESGATILELTEWFPGLTADNIRDVLRFAAKSAAAQSMRILFDQGVPVPLRKYLSQLEVTTVYELGWSDFTNGDLIQKA